MNKISVGVCSIESKDAGDFYHTAPKNVKCNCGHTIKDHWHGGWCHSSGHPKEGQCGCTWFYPNDKYIIRKQLICRKSI
jgi:hypothetical protein